jgi:Mg2+/Co2+ transporter CorB
VRGASSEPPLVDVLVRCVICRQALAPNDDRDILKYFVVERIQAFGQKSDRCINRRPKIAQREDGSYLIDASVPFPDAMRLAGISEAPFGDYVTLAGFILSQLHELPKPGDNVMWASWRFEVVDMDGRRIDAILAQSQP